MKEVWKDIEGYEGLYQVSNMGRVKSLERYVNFKNYMKRVSERILVVSENRGGYLQVNLCKDGKAKGMRIHRIVAETFIPNHEGKRTVNHIDGNKKNNAVDNLEWATHKENLVHAYETGLNGGTHLMNKKGSFPVLQYDLEMNLIASYPSLIEAKRQTDIPYQCISQCCKGKYKSSGGYIWKFAAQGIERGGMHEGA